MVSLPATRSATHRSKCCRNTFTRIGSGTSRLKSGDSGAKCPTNSGFVGTFLDRSGIAHGHLLTPPPHSVGIGPPGWIASLWHVVPSSSGPSCELALAFAPQNVDAMYSPTLRWV